MTAGSPTRERVPVAVLGATGTVGQKLVRLLADHPWFRLLSLAASDRNAGRPYGEAVRWREPLPLPSWIAELPLAPTAPPLAATIAFSALDADAAGPIEQAFARCGTLVVTNTRTHRMDPDVPLVIPEVNPDHLELLSGQRRKREWTGGIVANPNCSTAALTLALAPLHATYGVRDVIVTTMQAASGAGYPGVPSLDLLGNVIPGIAGEEEKLKREMRKLLGARRDDGVEPAPLRVGAHTHRVPVVDGHLLAVSCRLSRPASPEAAAETWRGFRAPSVARGLPSTPEAPVRVDPRPDRPQPRLDAEAGGGMTVTVGRVRVCPVLGLAFSVLGHNTVRGAAGAAIQLAELAVAAGAA